MKIDWKKAPDVKKKINRIIAKAGLDWLKHPSIYCFRSTHAQTRACARIWGLSRIWQQTLKLKPAYIIEVIAERFDRLSLRDQEKVLLHELAHIPKNFSGALVPHIRRGRRKFSDKVKRYESNYFTRRLFN
ncbi:metallopeptidase [Candidatus Woesebacteria bacterium CG22_combo_CG10-13_8_21_14_all_45_10]|uniref:Metallopeptidase n=1 Tax=Candidatus Woesebacteria bacterium CG22_combo_CG10-13_8_21_14_all_45_10 TaxID=1975060 RepID=A0A2H0BJ85_9BACT|nr:MAG: metallopeptidase [Candidatus Woesebacteria bacterium CG22_combo_CG10-13_8_21_14_all_45_10]